MRFSELLAASLVAPLVAAHGDIPGAPKIFGLGQRDLAKLKSRNILGGYAKPAVQGPQLYARQGGNAQGRCGPAGGYASCAAGYCCSAEGWCGQGTEYCAAPDGLYEYGPANDANVLPTGGTTRNIARTKLGNQPYGGAGVWVCTKPGTVAITYDDGPYIYTTDVLDKFAAYGFKATFFITGINIGKGSIDDASKPWPAMIKRMISEKHQVASHTWSHQDLSAISSAQRYEQMIRLEMALSNVIGKFPTYMRPPYSSCTAASGCEKDLADLGYVVSYFDLDTDDYNNITPDKIQNAKDRFRTAISPSNPASDEFLAIAHDIHQQTAQNLTGYMLDYLVSKGYKGVTMGECLNEPEANWYRSGARVATSTTFTPPQTRTSSSVSRASTVRPTSTPTGVTSLDGTCGGTNGYTCVGFSEGECCSQYGWCGNTADHCGATCNPLFGKCTSSSSSSSRPASSSVRTSSSSRPASSSIRTSSSTRPASSTRATSSSRPASSSTRASSTRTSSTVPSSTPSGVTSQDGTCGGTNGYTCIGFSEGECCSQYGWCGNTADHCGVTCNPLFGKCTSSSSTRPASSTRATSTRASSTLVSSIRTSSVRTSSVRTSSVRTSSTRTSSVRTSTRSSAPAATASKVTSPDATCGGTKGYTCIGFSEGECCSQYGWCGNTSGHCSTGCQAAFGKCT